MAGRLAPGTMAGRLAPDEARPYVVVRCVASRRGRALLEAATPGGTPPSVGNTLRENTLSEATHREPFILSVVRWFDSWSGIHHESARNQPMEIDWLRVIPFLMLHAACLLVL